MAKPILTSMILFETGGFERQSSRGYRTKNFTDGDVDQLVRSTDHGRNISSGTLSRAVSKIIELDSTANTNIFIPNGWDEKRLSFIIELLLNEGKSNECRQVLTGYTDKSDLSFGGEMDPAMQLFINNSFILTSYAAPGRSGRGRRSRFLANDYIIRSAHDTDDRSRRRERPREHLLRSEDIFYNRDCSETLSRTRSKVYDGRSLLDGELKLARRADDNITNYLESILRVGVTAQNRKRTDDYHFGEIGADAPKFEDSVADHSRSSVYETASGFTRSGDVDTHGIFADWLLDTDFENSGMIELASFEDSVVLGCEPVIIEPGKVTRTGRSYSRSRVGDYEEWGGSHHDDILPDIIKSSITSLMLRYTLAEADILITNDTADGQLHCHVSNDLSIIQDFDTGSYLDTVETSIVSELGPILTRDHHDDITITINYNMLSGMVIEIDHLDGSTPVRYNAAIWADGIQTNMRTEDETRLETMSTDFEVIVDEIIDSADK